MSKELIIVFVKNAQLGKVKTRLAKTIGNKNALFIYNTLVGITKNAINNLNISKRIYFSETIENNTWPNTEAYVQNGNNLGQRMQNAFTEAFADGYERVVLIGSDLPDINKSIIQNALTKLENNTCVFGPADDGGYYLIGLSKMTPSVFKNKPWSQPNLLQETTKELQENNITFSTLETLNDIDTFDDLKASTFYKLNVELQEKLKKQSC
ncbi:glycosyltransferase [Seonamhaeicola algicola]|uniref:Glycosyltransferase n=1 Tax=Seonamhaeicola algicola TaxID=1719036 RepID=A0A5C7AFA3_9FLAO|nr:TIGR04282 family arsenosugar biosynthesis glycosyltransferase [Seonamhaeicola algicola]TXE06183.1 glycosyltransferase [Seonamhaeicola algicola]